MFETIRKHGATIAIAGITALVVAAGPAFAGTVVALAKNSLRLGGKPASAYQLKSQIAHNADKLDGIDSTGFVQTQQAAAYGFHTGDPIDDFTTGAFTTISTKTFSAPSAGFLFIVGTISAEDDSTISGIGRLFYQLTVDGTAAYNTSFAFELSYSSTGLGNSGATSAVVAVAAGSHTVNLQAREAGTGSFIEGHGISAVFVPAGSGTSIPAGTDGTNRNGR